MHALGLEFGSAAQLSKRPGSVWNCLWGHALERSPGIIRKSRVSYPGPGFLSSATWPSLPKKYYNGLINIRINNCVIDRVHVTKFLGVLMDEKLNWKKHITLFCSKLSKSLGVIYKASRLLNTPALYTLYCTLFLPYLHYCAEVWGNKYKSNVLPLIMKQKSYQNCM